MALYKRDGVYYIDIADKRLPGGRVAGSAKTTKKPEAEKRHAALRTLIDRGEYGLVARFGKPKTRGGLHITDVQNAVAKEGGVEELKATLAGVKREPLLLGAAIDRLLRSVKATRSVGTLKAYEAVMVSLERKFGVARGEDGALTRDVPLAPITSDQLREWLHEPKEKTGGKPWSHRRQALARSLAKKLFRLEISRAAEAADRIGAKPELRLNPLASVEAPTIRQTRVVFLKPEEWRALIAKAEGRPVAAALGLWCLAGLRLMEAAHLRTDIDVVLSGPRPYIEVQPRDGEFPWRAKTDRSNRRIPVVPGSELHRLLVAHAEVYAGARYFIRPAKEDRPYGPIGLRSLAKEAFTAAGIKWGSKGDALSVHSLRHTFVSWLVQRDVQALKIARLIGDRPEQIYRTYGHLLPQDLDAVVGVIDAVATNGGEK